MAISQAINLIFMKGTGPQLTEKFYSRLFSVDWEDLLKVGELNVDKQKCIYLRLSCC